MKKTKQKGQVVNSTGIQYPHDQICKVLKEGKCYKYLRVLKFDEVLTIATKERSEKKYIRRIRKFMKKGISFFTKRVTVSLKEFWIVHWIAVTCALL